MQSTSRLIIPSVVKFWLKLWKGQVNFTLKETNVLPIFSSGFPPDCHMLQIAQPSLYRFC